jgi:DNA replication protein DnaC
VNKKSNQPKQYFLGDPDCPYCHGNGYLRDDYPLDHPDFGKLRICTCRQDEISNAINEQLYSFSNLSELKHLTFENFEPRGRKYLGKSQADSLQMAYNTSLQYSKELNGWLLLTGGFGCGKTHLAAAIANFVTSIGISTIFITVPDLLDALRYTYNDPTLAFEDRFEEIRNVPLLIMDDFGTHNATSWAQEKLFQILNYRYINNLPLVITTNLHLNQIEGRMRSRLKDSTLVTHRPIYAPDYRQPGEEIGHHELSCLELFGNKTFKTFKLRNKEGFSKDQSESLSDAVTSAKDFSDNPKGWLVFRGAHGSGKTHLAAGIANHRAAMGEPPLFITVPDLLDHLRTTFNPNSPITYDRRFEDIKNTHLLILDDFGAQAATPWAQEKLFQLLNFRYNAELPTVITMGLDYNEIDDRLLSRILDRKISKIIYIEVPPYYQK